MKIKFEVTYDSDTGFLVESNDVRLRHSGSSYLRIKPLVKKEPDYQWGTIGGYCPGGEEMAKKVWDDCKYDHLSFCIEKAMIAESLKS